MSTRRKLLRKVAKESYKVTFKKSKELGKATQFKDYWKYLNGKA